MARADRRGDPATYVPRGAHLHATRLQAVDQVVQHTIGDVLVEVPFLSKAPEIQLEAFELDDLRAGYVRDGEGGEVWLTGHRAHTGELGADALDLIVPAGVRVVDGDKLLGGLARSSAAFWLGHDAFRPNSDQTDWPRNAAQKRFEASDGFSAAFLGMRAASIRADRHARCH